MVDLIPLRQVDGGDAWFPRIVSVNPCQENTLCALLKECDELSV